MLKVSFKGVREKIKSTAKAISRLGPLEYFRLIKFTRISVQKRRKKRIDEKKVAREIELFLSNEKLSPEILLTTIDYYDKQIFRASPEKNAEKRKELLNNISLEIFSAENLPSTVKETLAAKAFMEIYPFMQAKYPIKWIMPRLNLEIIRGILKKPK